MKKHWIWIALAAVVCALLALLLGKGGCKGEEIPVATPVTSQDSAQAAPKEDNTHVGATVLEASMHYLLLLTDAGDTLELEMPLGEVLGGAKEGDQLDLTYYGTSEGKKGLFAVNMTMLPALWTVEGDTAHISLELDPNGHATVYGTDRFAYDSWEQEDGKLLLHTSANAGRENAGVIDVYDILRLESDTLLLAKDDNELKFWREN